MLIFELQEFKKYILKQEFLYREDEDICEFINSLGMNIDEFSLMNLEEIRKYFQQVYLSEFLNIVNMVQESYSTISDCRFKETVLSIFLYRAK